jgi:ABC-2 type transport system ATP-binding protein
MTTTQGIEVANVRRSFGEVHAVRDASFVAGPGTVTGLIGPNGSGKTTLMLVLASLLKPDSGSIRIAGHDPVTDTSAVRSQLGWMPDVLGSWSSLSVRTTLQITGRLYKLEKYQAVQRAEELLLLVGLGHLADQPTRVLSRGQKQRLSLARALVHDPSGKTVLVSSHVLAELDEMADGAVYIGAGVTASDETMAATRQTLRQWRIKAADATALETALVELGTYRGDIARDRSELLVPVAGETAAAELLARLVAAGIPISTFAPAVGDLEHSFLDLSKGGN